MSEVHNGGLGAAKRPSLEEILKGIPPELLNQPCQDKHLCEVAHHVTNWLSLAPLLGISEAEENEILGNWPRNTAKQKIDFFRKWQEKRGRKATYRRLCKVVWKSCEVSLVEKICDIVTSPDSSGSESDEDESCNVNASVTTLAVNQQPRSREMECDSMSLRTDQQPPTGSNGLDSKGERMSSKPYDFLHPIPRPRIREGTQGSKFPPPLHPKSKRRCEQGVSEPPSIHPPPPLPLRDSRSGQYGASPQLYQFVDSVLVGSKPEEDCSLAEWRQWRQVVLNILHCLYEAQDMFLCLYVASLLGDNLGGLDLYGLSLSPFDCLCVGYFLCCVCIGGDGEFAVNLKWCGLDSFSVGCLVKELNKCSDLGVSRCSSDAVMGCLAIDLWKSSIDGSGVRLLCELMNNPSVIRRLDLNWNERIQHGEDGLLCLLQMLRSNHSLVEVKLVECNLRIDGVNGPAFVKMLRENDSLKVLELGWNDGINDIGVGYIAEGMAANCGVVRLGLAKCGIGADGGRVLGRMLSENQTLESLNLWLNEKLGDAGLMDISQGIKVNCRLEELIIGHCGYSLECYDCLKEFVLSLKENGHLRRLGVREKEVELLVEETAAVNDLRRQRGEMDLAIF